MKLTQITFTGVDMATDLSRLREIQKQYPFAEFGVLASFNSAVNGNRYPNPLWFDQLSKWPLNLALHVCGTAATCLLNNQWYLLDTLTNYNQVRFKRIQLNVAKKKYYFPATKKIPCFVKELIIQQSSEDNMDTYKYLKDTCYDRKNIAMLYDPSGGKGLLSDFNYLNNMDRCGYAGGLNESNIAEVLTKFLQIKNNQTFWLDLESGARTDDWFDLNKVENILSICKQIIDQFQ